MALTKKDLHQIQNIMKAGFATQDVRFDHRLKIALDQQAQDIKRDIRDEMGARFLASEQKITQNIRAEFMDVLQQNILPVIDRAFTEIGEVRRFVGMA